MAFTVNMTGTTEVPDSIIEEYDAEFRVAFAEMGSMTQFATLKREIGAKAINLPKYEQLNLALTPLDEKEDVDSEALVDSKVIIIPAEYGNAVTTTTLASLQTGGMVDRASARMVGINAGRTQNKLAILACDAGTNIILPVGRALVTEIEAGDTMDATFMGKAYNLLARNNVPGLSGNDYFMVAHDDVIHDIREQSGANSWIDAHKYALPEALLKNEVGMYKGFRVVRDNLSTIVTDGGLGAVDVYNSYFLGFNAFGYAESSPIEMVATGPFDKLNRFVNMGWKGCFNFKIVEQQALVVGKTSSSVGSNV